MFLGYSSTLGTTIKTCFDYFATIIQLTFSVLWVLPVLHSFSALLENTLNIDIDIESVSKCSPDKYFPYGRFRGL